IVQRENPTGRLGILSSRSHLVGFARTIPKSPKLETSHQAIEVTAMRLRYLAFGLPFVSSLTLVMVFAGSAQAADEEIKSIPGIGPAGKIVKLHTGFKFTEGPAADRDGNVYFSDIPNQRIHKVDTEGKLSVFREKSNRANGLMVNAKGEIVACEMAGRVVAISPDGERVRVLADKYEANRSTPPTTWSSTPREASTSATL